MNTEYFDDAEIADPVVRENGLFARLPVYLAEAISEMPGLARWLGGADPAAVTNRDALARLPVLHKDELMELQKADPPFGGFAKTEMARRIFMSPGPIFEPQGSGPDPWNAARAFFAAGVRPGSRVHNAFSYHLTPGGFILDEGARALGCCVLPAGTGNSEMQIEAALAFKPDVYCGTPDFLKTLLDKASNMGSEIGSFRRGLVSGGALFPSMRAEYRQRGIQVMQCYATAECGVIAYETHDDDGEPCPGMVVNENMIVEIVTPGTGDPVTPGTIGEVVVTCFNPAYPLVRLATGDLSAHIPERSPCGRTNMRISGWMGRADQRTKIKGMFVDPRQIARVLARHPEISKARLEVRRKEDSDVMNLRIETAAAADTGAIGMTLREITKISGTVEIVSPGTLPNDGKIIDDTRDYSN